CLVEGYKIRFTGKRLDQADFDVYQTIISLWRYNKVDDKYPEFLAVSGAELLRLAGKVGNGNNSKILVETIYRLKRAEVSIDHCGVVFSGNLIKDTVYNSNSKKWLIEINPRLSSLFEDHKATIDFAVRRELRGDFTKWIHNFYCTQDDPQNHPFSVIKKIADVDWDDKTLAFRLREAFAQLVELGAIESGVVDIKIKKVFVVPAARKHIEEECFQVAAPETYSFYAKKPTKKGTGRGKVAL
ncbi:MAG TPA: hypothetical protein VM577_15435, partial [Anaerovoracaceae bacterium]|nr:hypothetical protein [Anaerovoracaceae bacterium]